MICTFQKEIKFQTWLEIRQKEGMPPLSETCNIGLVGGPQIYGAKYQSNNFDKYTRFYQYQFEFSGQKLRETLDIAGMIIHIHSETDEEQQSVFLQNIASLLELGFIGSLENGNEYHIIEILKATANENGIRYEQFDNEFIFYHEYDQVEAKIFNGNVMYFNQTNNDKLQLLIKKVKAYRLQTMFK